MRTQQKAHFDVMIWKHNMRVVQQKNPDDLAVENVALKGNHSPLYSVAPVLWHQQLGLGKDLS